MSAVDSLNMEGNPIPSFGINKLIDQGSKLQLTGRQCYQKLSADN